MLCLFIEDVDDTVDVDPPDPAGGLTVCLCYKKKINIFTLKMEYFHSNMNLNITILI